MGNRGKKQLRTAGTAVLLLAVLCMGMVPHAAAARSGRLIPMGTAVGIKLFSNGVLVVGLSGVDTREGTRTPGKDCGLQTGDIITHINGAEVDTVEQVKGAVARAEGALDLRAVRGERQLRLAVEPAVSPEGERKLGIWLRDSMAGIGTVTWYDPDSGSFAALGHGINDTDTAVLMPMESGSIMPARVAQVKKGLPGQPGELRGEFDPERDLGRLEANTVRGIFGEAPGLPLPQGAQAVETAERDEVKKGRAVIRSNVRGEQVEEFQVEILCVDPDSRGGRDMMLKVTDPALLALTGGIVQGMSGSPIIQDGKLVGAVTHVLVNDPTRGYGIFIENMLDAAG